MIDQISWVNKISKVYDQQYMTQTTALQSIASMRDGQVPIGCVLCMFLSRQTALNVVFTWHSHGVHLAGWFWQLFSWKNQCLCLRENKRKEKSLVLRGKLTRRRALIGDRIIDTVFKGCFPQSNTSNMQLLLKGLISSLSYTMINFIELVSTVCD